MFTCAESVRTPLFSTRAEGFLLLLVTSFSWGLHWPQAKFLMSELPPFTARAVPCVAGALFAFAVALLMRQRLHVPRALWARLVLFGILNYGGFTVFTTLSLVWLRASEAVIITYTLPIWAGLLAWPILGERLTLRRIAAMLIALTGIAVLAGIDSFQASISKLPGVICGLIAAVLFGLATVLVKKNPLGLPPVAGVAWQSFIGSSVLAVFAAFEHPDWRALTPLGYAAGAYIIIMPQTVAYLAWFRALRLVPASMAATTVLLSPIIGVIASALMLGDPLGPRQLIALAVTLTGVGLAARS